MTAVRTARIVDDRDLWTAARTVDEYVGVSPLAWFEQHIVHDWDFNCWLWTGWKKDEYGGMAVGSQNWFAHRFSYEIHRGSTLGLPLDHRCRNTICVNPWHLEPVSGSENSRRARGVHRISGRRQR